MWKSPLKMPRLSAYVLRQMAAPVALFTFLLTGVVWLSQSLQLLDLVINRGQSAPTFVYLTLLLLPSLLVLILPIAFFAGTLYGLHKLNSDSELVVMSACGYSRSQLATPVMIAAVAVMLLTFLCSLWLMPLGHRTMKSAVMDIRADIGAAILNEGDFNTPADGLTVFMRELSPDGHIHGILVHDDRDEQRPTTYIAQSGLLVQTAAGGRLVMMDGTIEQNPAAFPGQLSVLKFQRYVFDLDQFAGPQQDAELEASDRYLNELFWPVLKNTNKNPAKAKNTVAIYAAEGHNRLAAPLYCLTFALIALAAVTSGRRQRGAYALRLTAACLLGGGLRIFGYGAQSMVARHPPLWPLLYLIPLAGAGLALLEFDGARLTGALERWRSPTPLPEPAT
ncbi:MAG TPA: LPS export ABC transporter permease LptF [Rhizomicrobium sp.]|nr:LPS export ABC transporter permease LptF [Rhizomicrobium sp.]